VVTLNLTVKLSDPPEIKSVKFKGEELLKRVDDDADFPYRGWKLWKLGHMKFTVKQLKEMLSEAWSVPPAQLELKSSQKMDADTQYRLPKGFCLGWPERET
jgi:hypothetical protein